ncbi:beta-galactosidase, partial [Salmonella enterica]|nr:glycosyl hydrolase family 35 [Salmonella enterica subsp. enterica serovar Enteritidis]
MLEGGTNWGWTGAPASGFTSYDYGAALDEERTLTDKFAVQKEIGYFQRALPWLAATNPVSAPEPTQGLPSPRVPAHYRRNRTTLHRLPVGRL